MDWAHPAEGRMPVSETYDTHRLHTVHQTDDLETLTFVFAHGVSHSHQSGVQQPQRQFLSQFPPERHGRCLAKLNLALG